MYSQRNLSLLAEEPLYFPTGNEVVKLEPKRTNGRFPVSRTKFFHAVNMMKFPSDFDAIPDLVRGFAQASVPLKWDQLEMAVRNAAFKGRGDILFKILEDARWNGVRASRVMYREAMKGFLLQARIPDRKEVVQAVKGSRRLRKLIVEQDSTVLREWKAAVDKNEKAKAAEDVAQPPAITPDPNEPPGDPLPNEPPLPFHSDPLALGFLAGVMAHASNQVHGGLDHNAFIAFYIGELFGKQSWPQLQNMLSQPPDLEKGKYRDRREQIFRNLHSTRDLGILAHCLKSVAAVLSKTSAYLLEPPSIGTPIGPSVLPPARGKYKKSPEEHGLAIAQLVKNIQLELPILEQNTEKWEKNAISQVMDVFKFTEDKAREKLVKSIHRYDDALEEMGRLVGERAKIEVEQEEMDEAYAEDPEEFKEEEEVAQ